MPENTSIPKTLMERLQERRFFPLFGSYLLGGWALVQFVDWISARYALSDFWSEATLILFLVMIPAAVVLIYRHGAPGDQPWSKFEKMGIPLNILLALSLLFVRNNNLASAPEINATVIEAVDEKGQSVSRLVPKVNSTKKIAVFPFKNKMATENQNWLRYAFPSLIDSDLEQDSRLYAISSFNFGRAYNNYGHDLNEDISFAIQRKIANDEFSDVFIQGEYTLEGDQWRLSTKAFTTKDGKEFYNNDFTGSNFYTLVDDFTSDFKKQLQLIEVDGNKNLLVDLPADGLISSKPKALEYYFNSRVSSTINNNSTKAIDQMKEAIAIDPDCTECYYILSWIYSRNGKGMETKAAIKKAVGQSDHLPERQKLAIKNAYYRSIDDFEKAIALNEMWRKFYPNDYKPYSNLFHYHITRADFKKAIAIGEEAVSVGHSGDIYLMMAELQVEMDNPEPALKYLEEFKQKFPNRLKETKILSTIYEKQGEFQKARDHLENLNLMEPSNIEILRDLAALEIKTGHFIAAENYLNEAFNQSNNARDSTSIFKSLEALYFSQGRGNAAIETLRKRHTMQQSFTTSMETKYEFMMFPTMVNFINVGQQEVLEKELLFFTENDDPSFQLMACACNINYYLATKQLEKFEEVNEKCRAEIIQRQGENVYLMIDAFLYEMKGDYKKAAEYMSKTIEETSIKSKDLEICLIRMQRKDEALAIAKEKMDALLKTHPVDGELFLEMAYIEKGLGNNIAAKEWRDKALDVWKEADEEYHPAKEAREMVL